MNNNQRQLKITSNDSNISPKTRQHSIKRRLFLGGLIVGMSAVTFCAGEYLLRQITVTLADTTNREKTNFVPPGQARLNLVFILDGLRPDSINPQNTPNLYRLRQEGVNYVNSHAVFPTVTRVNSTAIGTGYYPGKNGIVSNSMYVPQVNQEILARFGAAPVNQDTDGDDQYTALPAIMQYSFLLAPLLSSLSAFRMYLIAAGSAV